MLKIEIVFASPNRQETVALAVNPNCSIAEAIRQSGINNFFPEYDLLNLPVGIFGKRIYEPSSYNLQAGDRIEIYRPLTKTPNQKRLDRAKNN